MVLDELEAPGVCPVCGAPGFSCRNDVLGSSPGVRIRRLSDPQEGTMHTLTEKTFVNADSTAVAAEGSVEAAWLLGLEGDEISDETAERLGLTGSKKGKKKAKSTADETAEEAEVETAQVETAAEA
jgi:hypothetical protein